MTHRTDRRRRPLFLAATLAAAFAGLGLARGAFAQTVTGDQPLDFALAERFALWADEAVTNPQTPEPILREAAAMLDLARQYKPREVRFARSSADVLLRLGERDRALAALSALRQLDPTDQLAQIQFVDLNADKMETTETRAAYLKQIADLVGVAPEVRSHAASLLMQLYFERSQDAQALEAMSQAISLNPQNLVALHTKYDVAAQTGVATERAKALAGILQASPADPANLIAMAQECAAAGDYENAARYYQYGMNVVRGSGQSPPIDQFIEFLAVQMLAGQTAAAEPLVAAVTQQLTNEPRVYALQIMLAAMNGKTDADLNPQIVATRGVYLAQLATMSQALNAPDNKTPPATNPAVPMPDVRADAAKLVADKSDKTRGLRSAYAVALAEQVWFDAFFRAAPVEPASIEALATLIGDPNDPLVVRLEGWRLLAANQPDEAMVKLTAIADRDGYAKLGLAAAATAKHDDAKAKEILTQLLTDRPSGMYGAAVALQAKRAGIHAPDLTPTERQIAGLAGSLKNGIENLLNNPRMSYLLSARPLTISVPWGEPMLAEVRILNNGSQPVTIGPGALIQPKFSVDLATRGIAPKVFAGTLLGSWTGPIRLLPQQQLVQVVRVDRGPFRNYLEQYPTAQFTMNGMLTINPMIVERGSFPAPGGEQGPIGDGTERKASPLHIEAFRTQLLQQMSGGSPVERLHATELAATVVPLLRQQTSSPDAMKIGADLSAAVDGRVSGETSAEVKALETIAAAQAAADAPTKLPTVLGQLASSDNAVGQAAALWTARSLTAPQRQAVAQQALGKNPQGPVLELATALSGQPDLPPPPAPTTQPNAAPASTDATQP